MHRPLAHVLALITASSAMLAGMPLLAACAAHDVWPAVSVAACPSDFDAAGEFRGASVEEEREEEAESTVHLSAGRLMHGTVTIASSGATVWDGIEAGRNARLATLSIRGPPAA